MRAYSHAFFATYGRKLGFGSGRKRPHIIGRSKRRPYDICATYGRKYPMPPLRV